MSRTNRQARRAMDFKSLAAQGWSSWEWRNDLVGHPEAMSGMKCCCLNNRYSVQFFEQITAWGKVDHLLIRRHDGKANVPWADKQRIKDELMGADRTAVEVYPAVVDLVDEADVYHLWVLPEGMKLPFGLSKGWSK